MITYFTNVRFVNSSSFLLFFGVVAIHNDSFISCKLKPCMHLLDKINSCPLNDAIAKVICGDNIYYDSPSQYNRKTLAEN